MKRILVALDSSPRAKDILAAGIDLAQRTHAKIHLLRAVGLPPELPSHVSAIPPAQVAETFLATARAEMNDISASIPPGMLEGTDTVVGVAWDVICRVAKEQDVDMIVIGSHGYGILDRLLGTTAAKVVNHADRSVLVVRNREVDAK